MRKAAFAWLAVCLLGIFSTTIATTAEARYQFDDLYGPSGNDPQWMVLTGSSGSETYGDPAKLYNMDVSGDLVSQTEGRHHVALVNGHPEDDDLYYEGERYVHSLFLALLDSPTTMKINFNNALQASEATTPNLAVLGDNIKNLYTISMLPQAIPNKERELYHTTDWGQFIFDIAKKNNTNTYESVRGNFAFHQNPSATPSQTLEVPFVIANVYNGTAAMARSSMRTSPLIIRATLYKKDYSEKNIIHSRVINEWFVDKDLEIGDDKAENDQWVIIPQSSSGTTDKYYLSLEVTNHTGTRYAMQRYDSFNWRDFNPEYWKFDIPYTQGNGDVPARFYLNRLSHIAPGLVTVYNHSIDLTQSGNVKDARLRLYPVDPVGDYRTLVLYYRIIFADSLGEDSNLDDKGCGYKAQAFKPKLEDEKAFLTKVREQMKTQTDVKIMTDKVNKFTGKADVGASAISPFRVQQDIPKNLQASATTTTPTMGMLPVEITFRINRSDIYNYSNRAWDKLVAAWNNGDDIYDTFKEYFSIYLECPAHDDAEDNPWNLIQELEKQTQNKTFGNLDLYKDQIKISLDEKKSTLTVNFVTMLLDGTRDQIRPALSFVADEKSVTNNRYMIIRDGNADGVWDLTYYIAPADYHDNNENSNNNNNQTPSTPGTDESKGGGGCSGFGLGVMTMLALAALGIARKRA